MEMIIKATEVGTSHNLSAGLIRVVSPSITGIVTCKNPSATSGGTNEESDLSLLSRVEDAATGRNLDTVNGYKSFIEAQTNVVEAYVADPIDDLMTRYPVGAVDIWTRVSSGTIDRTQVITGDGSETEFLLEYQPVQAYVSSTGVGYPYTVTLSEDTTSGYAHSTQAQSKVVFASAPAYGEEVTVTYRQYEDIYILQSLLDTDENRVAGGDVLVKRAQPVTIDIRMDLNVYSGYSETLL